MGEDPETRAGLCNWKLPLKLGMQVEVEEFQKGLANVSNETWFMLVDVVFLAVQVDQYSHT